LYNEAIENNEEGIVIKRLNRPYENGSRTNWIKLKPILENSFRIIDVYSGTGKYENTIGSVLVTDKYSKIYAKVGSGLTDLIRIKLEERLADKSLIGAIIDVKYNEITSNKNGTYSLRFPRFLKFRDDKLEPDEVKR
jgi:DNA ligase 1